KPGDKPPNCIAKLYYRSEASSTRWLAVLLPERIGHLSCRRPPDGALSRLGPITVLQSRRCMNEYAQRPCSVKTGSSAVAAIGISPSELQCAPFRFLIDRHVPRPLPQKATAYHWPPTASRRDDFGSWSIGGR